jgi:outer membrane protein assembly factor BamB
MSRPSRVSILAVCVLVMGAGAAAAQTGAWTQFQGGPGHPGVAAGPEPGFERAWSVPVAPGGPGNRFGVSAPVFGDGVTLAVGPESVVAVDVATGEEAWTAPKGLGPSVPGAVASDADGALFLYTEGWGDGPPSPETAAASPTAPPSATPAPGAEDDDEVEVIPSALVAIGLDDDPDERWRVELPDVSRTGVTVIGSLAVVGSNDGTVTAVDLGSGETAWTADAGRAIDTPLAATDDVVVAATRGSLEEPARLVSFELADGTERWRFSPSTEPAFAGAPLISGDAVTVAFENRSVVAVSLADGSERWSSTLNGAAPLSPLAASEEAVVAIDLTAFGSQLYALDPATGDRRWDHPTQAAVFRTAPVVLGGSIAIGTIDGTVATFDAETGDQTWTSDGEGPIRSMAADGTTLVVVRAQPSAIEGYVHDPDATLSAIVSPTQTDLVGVIAAWAAGAAIAGALGWGLGRLLAARLGPAVFVGDEADDAGGDP